MKGRGYADVKSMVKIKGGKREAYLGRFIGGVMKLYGLFLRYECPSEVSARTLQRINTQEQVYIFAFWHNRILALPQYFRQHSPKARMACLTSASKDGAIIAAVMDSFGISSIRGSSSRGGKRAFVHMLSTLRAGTSISITPDGPRGPVYELNPGVVRLAAKSGKMLVPVQVEYSGYWELKSWDRFRIPKPFSKITIHFHMPTRIPEILTDEEIETYRLSLEQALLYGEA